MARKLQDFDKCEYEDCEQKATDLVYSRKKNDVLACCEGHAEVVIDEDNPEYHHQCDNCGCGLPIN